MAEEAALYGVGDRVIIEPDHLLYGGVMGTIRHVVPRDEEAAYIVWLHSPWDAHTQFSESQLVLVESYRPTPAPPTYTAADVEQAGWIGFGCGLIAGLLVGGLIGFLALVGGLL